MRTARTAVALGSLALGLLALAGCAPRVPPVRAPAAPSTHRDPPPYLPAPERTPVTGALVGVVASSGEEQARAILVTLVEAIAHGDAEALRAALAPEVFHGGSLLAGRTRRGVDGRRVADQLVAAARIARLAPETPFDALIEVDSIRVETIAGALPDPLPPVLSPGDVVVRFTATPLGRRPLAGIVSGNGEGALVIRPGEDPRVVAR